MNLQINKKYVTRAFAALMCLSFFSCSEDELSEAGLTVINSNVNMSAAASTGYIIVSQSGGFTASSSQSWCTVECRDDSVLVSVTDNTALEGRTAVVTVTAIGSSQSTSVPVSQRGGWFRTEDEPSEFRLGDADSVFSYALTSSFDFTISSDADWLSALLNSDDVQITVAENTTGAPRYGLLSFYSSKFDRTISAGIYQYDLNDLTGSWTASWTDKNGLTHAEPVEVSTAADGKLKLTGLYEGIDVPLEAYQGSFAVVTNAYAGVYGGRFDIYVSGVTSSHIIRTKENEPTARYYACLPTFENDSFSYPFVPDSTFSNGEEMKGFALSAYANGSNQGLVDEYYDFSLSRP